MDRHTDNLLGALAMACSDAQVEAMAETGMDPVELAALLAVFTRPGSTVGQTAHAAGLTHSGAVRVADRLCGARLIERRPGADRRTVVLFCTSAGEDTARFALKTRRATLRRLTAGLTKREAASLRSIARKILSGLAGDQHEAWRICRLCDHGVCRGESCPVGSAVP